MRVNSFFGSLLSGISYARCRVWRYRTCLWLHVHVCVCMSAHVSGLSKGTRLLTEQELKTTGSLSTEVNLGWATRKLPSRSLFLTLRLYFCLSCLSFPFFFLPSFMHSISPSHHVPLLSPSESVASRWGASKVLIGTTLANGGRLEVARWCELMLSPHPLLAWSGRNKRRWSDGRKLAEWVQKPNEIPLSERDAFSSSLLMLQTQMEAGLFLASLVMAFHGPQTCCPGLKCYIVALHNELDCYFIQCREI